MTFAYEHRAPTDAALVGVVFDDSASGRPQLPQGSGATWPAVVDPDGQIAVDYGVRGPPETFLVSPYGKVVARLNGAVTSRVSTCRCARRSRR